MVSDLQESVFRGHGARKRTRPLNAFFGDGIKRTRLIEDIRVVWRWGVGAQCRSCIALRRSPFLSVISSNDAVHKPIWLASCREFGRDHYQWLCVFCGRSRADRADFQPVLCYVARMQPSSGSAAFPRIAIVGKHLMGLTARRLWVSTQR